MIRAHDKNTHLSDNGGEYTNRKIEKLLIESGTEHQLTVPSCSSQNDVTERKNCTLVEMTRCLPSKFTSES